MNANLGQESSVQSQSHVDDIDALYSALTFSATTSLLRKHLTKERLEKLRDRVTPSGGTLAVCIKSGCLNPQSICGLYATDPAAYDVFSELFNPVIMDYHKVTEIEHPDLDLGDNDTCSFGDLDPCDEFVVSTRVRSGRNLNGFGFPPMLSKQDRLDIEARIVNAMDELPDELKGKYYSLEDMSTKVQQQMVQDHFLFRKDSPFRIVIHGYDYWPSGRGIFFSKDKRFLIWVNEGDQLRVISMQPGGNLSQVWARFVQGIRSLERKLSFARHPKLGYLTFCPTNIGTSIRASVHVRIPLLSQQPDFKRILDSLRLDARGVDGEHSKSRGGVYDISNQCRLGKSEIDLVKEMKTGVETLISYERNLQKT